MVCGAGIASHHANAADGITLSPRRTMRLGLSVSIAWQKETRAKYARRSIFFEMFERLKDDEGACTTRTRSFERAVVRAPTAGKDHTRILFSKRGLC